VYGHVAAHQPTNARIAADTSGLSFATCRKALRKLEKHGLVLCDYADNPSWYINRLAREGEMATFARERDEM
jgi:hypothetical protein